MLSYLKRDWKKNAGFNTFLLQLDLTFFLFVGISNGRKETLKQNQTTYKDNKVQLDPAFLS